MKVFFIDDDTIERMKMERVVSKLKLPLDLEVFGNALTALKSLKYLDVDKLPNIILVDYNMPTLNGPEFISLVRATSRLKRVPIVVYTTSENPSDVKNSYKNGASGYIVKPLIYDEYVTQMKTVLEYWKAISVTYPLTCN
jgi:DNA-binding NarL/FixJ family response regulator